MAHWLEARGHTAMVEEEAGVPGAPSAPGREIAARADLLVVLGGDGTLIHAAGLCNDREVPILGVNMGALGFLTEVPRERAFPLLEKALNGDLAISQRLMLDVEVRYRDQALLSGTVLNDAVISKNALSHHLRGRRRDRRDADRIDRLFAVGGRADRRAVARRRSPHPDLPARAHAAAARAAALQRRPRPAGEPERDVRHPGRGTGATARDRPGSLDPALPSPHSHPAQPGGGPLHHLAREARRGPVDDGGARRCLPRTGRCPGAG